MILSVLFHVSADGPITQHAHNNSVVLPAVRADASCVSDPASGLPFITRVAWNEDNWRRPSGAATNESGTYVAEYGFGHEEWLNRREWLHDGFSTPFSKASHARLLGCRVSECAFAYARMRRTGCGVTPADAVTTSPNPTDLKVAAKKANEVL